MERGLPEILSRSQAIENSRPNSQISLIRTPKKQNQVSALKRCPYYRGRECMIFFAFPGTKRTVRNRGLSVRRDPTVFASPKRNFTENSHWVPVYCKLTSLRVSWNELS